MRFLARQESQYWPFGPGLPKPNAATDHVMRRDLKHMLENRGSLEGDTTKPGDFVVARAFVEQSSAMWMAIS